MRELLNKAWQVVIDLGKEEAFMMRHNIQAAGFLTIADDETAEYIAEYLAERVADKVVVEIGGGLGLLALHLGQFAKRVYCIEANPVWASAFVEVLLVQKPKNVSYLFGAADEFIGGIRGDVALFCTHSGITSMRLAAAQFAPEVIEVYGELIAKYPGDFDATASELRKVV